MIGTGIYLDDVETTLAHIDEQAAANIERTVMWIGGIALAALAVIAVCTAVLNVSEHRSADAKLKHLAQQVVDSQEKERARLSRELHDGISQMLVSVKLLLESALARFERGEARVPAAEAALATSLGGLATRCAKCAASRTRCGPRCSTTSASPPRSSNSPAN